MQHLTPVHRPVINGPWLNDVRELVADNFQTAVKLGTGSGPRVNLVSLYGIRRMPYIDEADCTYLLGAFAAAQANEPGDPLKVPATNFFITNRHLLLGLMSHSVLV